MCRSLYLPPILHCIKYSLDCYYISCISKVCFVFLGFWEYSLCRMCDFLIQFHIDFFCFPIKVNIVLYLLKIRYHNSSRIRKNIWYNGNAIFKEYFICFWGNRTISKFEYHLCMNLFCIFISDLIFKSSWYQNITWFFKYFFIGYLRWIRVLSNWLSSCFEFHYFRDVKSKFVVYPSFWIRNTYYLCSQFWQKLCHRKSCISCSLNDHCFSLYFLSEKF